MASHDTWFIPRQKRQLTLLVDYAAAFSNMVAGEKWSGNHELQLRFEDEISNRGLRNTGALRARSENLGGGGARTIFAQMKALGLVFEEDVTKKVRLTYAGEALISGQQTYVDVMRYQLLRFQYPSNQFYSGSSKVNERFHVHPFWLMLKLMTDERIRYLTTDEMKKIIIVEADSDSDERYEYLVDRLLAYRRFGDDMLGYSLEEKGQVVHLSENGTPVSDKFYDIANTFLAYLDATQYIERYDKKAVISDIKREEVREIVSNSPSFIASPELHENFQRRYGCDRYHSSDRRRFDENVNSENEMRKRRIANCIAIKAMNTPIREITSALITQISMETGYRESEVEDVARRSFCANNLLDGFLARYREMAFAGRSEALDFEIATTELFKDLFGFTAEHVGSLGNTPDVFIESENADYCAVIDNKAYSSYSISGDHHRRMVDVYIPRYSNLTRPLRFFSYIAGGFGSNINSQIASIHEETNVSGCAISVDQLIELIRRNEDQRYTHDQLLEIFSVNRRVAVSDM